MPIDASRMDEAVDAFVAATERFDWMWDPNDDLRDGLFGDSRRILAGPPGLSSPRNADLDAAVVAGLRSRWAEFRAVERRMAESAPRRPRRGAGA